MGLSTNTTTQNTSGTENQNSLESVSSNPTVPDWVGTPVGHLFSGIDSYLQTAPTATVTGPNNLQSTAFNKAETLGNNAGGYNTALAATGDVMGGSSTPATTTKVASTVAPLVTRGQVGTLAPATAAGVTNATAADTGKASTVSLQGYDPTAATSKGYTTSLLGDTSKFLPGQATKVSGASLLDGLEKYTNPATQALVDATMAEYDNNAGIARAQMQRQAAGSGAFGSSRYGIAQGQFEADTGRNRALTDAELRASAFDRATSLSGQDADRRQGADTTNAGAENALALARGNMGFQGLLADRTAQNDAARFEADAFNVAERQNAAAADAAARFGAEAGNSGKLFNAGAENDMATTNAGFRQATGLANADAANAAERQNAATRSNFDLSRFTAGNDMSQFNANEINDMATTWLNNANENNRADAAAANDTSKFNSNLGLQDRQLSQSAAGQYADILGAQSGDARANLASMLEAGNQQWAMSDNEKNALLRQLQAAGGLLTPAMIEALSGTSLTTQGTTNGTSTGVKQQTGSNGVGESLIGDGMKLLSMFAMSERRVKRDIALVGREPDGLGVYDFRYLWDDADAPLRRGTMVDEVERLRPWALGPIVGGVRTVNYGAL